MTLLSTRLIRPLPQVGETPLPRLVGSSVGLQTPHARSFAATQDALAADGRRFLRALTAEAAPASV